MKRIGLLGSTGSIGQQTLDVIRRNDDMQLVSLSGSGRNLDALEEQAREFCPPLVAVYDADAARDLAARLADTGTKVVSGMEGLVALAEQKEADILVTAIVGMIGIRPTMAAIRAGKDIALANKETLVTAGHLIMPLAREHGVQILPVDSEHSAIFQCLRGNDGSAIEKLLITASGGPFRGRTRAELADVTKEAALAHPNWAMGAKITIDSSTLVNKGLEVMEARWLFDVALDRIEVVVQPGSLIHSMVLFRDGAVMAQIGAPDMRLPIQYALTYPERRDLDVARPDFSAIPSIDLDVPDTKTFRGLPLAIDAARCGGSMPTVFNAANEEAVALFLADRIRFLDIYEIIETAMAAHTVTAAPDLDVILATEMETRRLIQERWN